jgi:UDP-N-acetyl-D-mannosaminuronic acid dehydrogenase
VNSEVGTPDRNVVVIGLGYVGLTLAAHLANLGFRVHGVEIRESVLEKLSESKAFFWEPNLNDTLARVISSGNLSFSKDIPQSSKTRVFIITVGTPLDVFGKANIKPIVNATNQVAEVLSEGDLVILRSTVKLGITNDVVRPILLSKTTNFDLAFCPERTLEGSALQELGVLPQIIGADSPRERERVAKFFEKSTSSIVMVSNTKTAEMIKLVDNMQRDAHFAISNEIAAMCNFSNVRAQEVINAGKIGYPRTNLSNVGPVGGPCLEKDSYILAETFYKTPELSHIALSARKTNESVIKFGAQFITNFLKNRHDEKGLKIAILGLAFKGKPETDDLRGSPSLDLVKELVNSLPESSIATWDPVVPAIEDMPFAVEFVRSIEEAAAGAHALVLMNNHPKLDCLDLNVLSSIMVSNSLIYDFWDRFNRNVLSGSHTTYMGWGNHAEVNSEGP